MVLMVRSLGGGNRGWRFGGGAKPEGRKSGTENREPSARAIVALGLGSLASRRPAYSNNRFSFA